jgi:hypothetical protein
VEAFIHGLLSRCFCESVVFPIIGGGSFINSDADGNQKEETRKETENRRVTPKDEQSSVMHVLAGHNHRRHHKFPAPQQDHQQRRWIYFLAADFLTFEQKAAHCKVVVVAIAGSLVSVHQERPSL